LTLFFSFFQLKHQRTISFAQIELLLEGLVMQTDRPGERVSAHLNEVQDQQVKRQNENHYKMVKIDGSQFRSTSFAEVSNMPERTSSNGALCDQSTIRMGAITRQAPLARFTRIPYLGTQPMPLIPIGILPEISTLPPTNYMKASQPKKGVLIVLLPWFYRCFLIGATGTLTLLLLRLQAVLDHVPTHTSIWQTDIQWAELMWLAPVPLAIILWLGWFIFAEAARPNPTPRSVPYITTKRGLLAQASTKPVRLIFRFVTRGDNIDVLRDSVIAVYQAFARYQQVCGPYEIEIVSECPISLNLGVGVRPNMYVVPSNYVTPYRSRFKARALTYLQKCTRPQPEDWYMYLDEESLIDEKLLAGLYGFVQQSIDREARAQFDKKKKHPAGWIGQGAILYQGGNWFFRGADALRTADDLGRFRLQYALGKPLFGVHGSFIVIRGLDDTRLSFDVGPANSITEDAAWALRAWAQGYRFAWVNGYLHEQPPQRVKDFVKQRSRWLSGIRAVLSDASVPFRYRLCLGIFTGLWQLAFLPFSIAILALFVHASPFSWMRLPADFAWATFILAYLHGIDLQAKHSHPFLKKKKIELLWKRIFSWLLVFCSVWYALLEAAGVIYSLRAKQGFFVIQKPSMAAENKVDNTHMQAYPQSLNSLTMERTI
jgi:beta-1,4-mannosyltransferase